MLQPRVRRGKPSPGDAHLTPTARPGNPAYIRVGARSCRAVILMPQVVTMHTSPNAIAAYSTSKSAVRGLAELPTESSARNSTR